MSEDVVYRDTQGTLRERSREALADDQLTGSLRTASATWAAGRRLMGERHPMPELRRRAREIRQRNIRDLPALLDRLEERVTAAGGTVYRAADAEAACRYVIDLARARGATLVAKSKSMATEEIKLNEALQEAGLRVVETDLGEWIIQLAGQHPSHIVAPAVHLNKLQVAALFARESGEEVPADREELVAFARRRMREVFAAADIGISGVNLGVAETGTLCVVENEGNGRLVTALPRIHVALMGMERVVADWDEAGLLLELLPMAAIGQDASTYVNLVTGPRGPGEVDGPEELHLIVLDGGRGALRGTEFEEALHCIRCGACLYSCPMWRSVGGQAYGSPYSGPDRRGHHAAARGHARRALQRAAVLLLALRSLPRGLPGRDPAARPAGARPGRGQHARAPARRAGLPGLEPGLAPARALPGAASPLSRLGLRLLARRRGWVSRVPGPMRAWTDQRDLPARWPPRP